jgi:transposase
VSDSAILRQLKRHVRKRREIEPLRAIAIDDWSWRKGFAYGTIIVDLERHTVADVLASRSVQATADWLKRHPGIEVVSRDRCGLYAEGIREGAPHARQVADRFHLLQNLRENIERELTSVSRHAGRSRLPAAAGDRQECVRRERRLSRQALFIRAKQMHAGGKTFVDIAAEIGIGHRTVAKRIAMDDLPHRQRLTLKPSSPLYFREFLTHRWSEGDRVGRRLFRDVRARGYVGSFSNLERLLSTWRRDARPQPSSRRQRAEPIHEPPRYRSGDGMADLTGDRRLTLHKAYAHAVRSCESGGTERSVAKLRRNAATGDAV